ncbi:Dienelactone hydrolase [Penicillium digitatum]|uniref:Dienelactone hydrolase n=1 Tax=Penicillium digitatum TaxID=36651 RepID=A0A7T7BJ77_PENDI|nr:Dienelactone hydrolase [Penicillium digitatum]
MANISISAPGLNSAETEDFDMETIRNWQEEGFDVLYLPYNGGGKDYARRLQSVKDGLGVGENYAVIAYGDAADYCLDYYINSVNASRLCALVAYYPSLIPDTRSRFPLSLHVLVHLAGETVDVLVQPVALGLQGKKRRQTRPINTGIGTGERLDLAYPAFTYGNAMPGFAETDLEEYDRLSAELAWSRTLKVLRKGYSRDPDYEQRYEQHVEGKFFFAERQENYGWLRPTQNPWYKLPPSMRLRLLSRTTGTDRIVDELYVSYEHTQEVPWMLPGVPPTNKRVEVILVSIVSVRAGRLYSEHVYWDQASVLVQIGLLDPKLLPDGVHGVDRLPVVGREAARRILHEDTELEQEDYHNKMIRRARARARRSINQSSRMPQAGDESGADLKREAEQLLPDRSRNKGKAVQKTKPASLQREAEDADEHDDNDGADTETEFSVKTRSEPGNRAAHVEDGVDDSAGNGSRQT